MLIPSNVVRARFYAITDINGNLGSSKDTSHFRRVDYLFSLRAFTLNVDLQVTENSLFPTIVDRFGDDLGTISCLVKTAIVAVFTFINTSVMVKFHRGASLLPQQSPLSELKSAQSKLIGMPL